MAARVEAAPIPVGRMRFRTTIVLIVLLLGLGAYVYWGEIPQAQQEAKKKTLVDFKPDDATGVSLAYADRTIVLRKTGDTWHITKPRDLPADATAAKNLVNAIAQCEVKKEIKEPVADLQQYGLDRPLVTVTVKLKDRELPAFAVGKNTPVGFSTYVQRKGDKRILLTSSAFRSGMDKQVKDLRDKTIVTFADNDVRTVELRGDGKHVKLVHKDDSWTIAQPGPYRADTSTIRSFLSTLRSMRAVDFPDDSPADLSPYGLDNPRLTLTLYLGKNNAEKRLLLGKETDDKKIYVQTTGQPAVYTVHDWVFRDLNKDVADFRDKTVLTFDRDKVTAVALQRQDGSSVKLVRDDHNHWHVEGAEGKPVETTITQYLTDLHELKGYEIAADHPTDLTAFGLDQPLLRLTTYGAGDKVVGTVLLGTRQAETKKEYTAMAAGGPTVFLVRDYVFTRLDKHPQDFVETPTPTAGAS
ncbi:MAG: DUF4340 domain-containing protein [Candidatus Binatia bacterium]